MDTTQTYDSASSWLGRSDAPYGLPTPLSDRDGGGECYPNDDNETGP
jgi:hypothetical protein